MPREIWWADVLTAAEAIGARSDAQFASVATLLGFTPRGPSVGGPEPEAVLPATPPTPEEGESQPSDGLVTTRGRGTANDTGPPISVLEPVDWEPIVATLRPGPTLALSATRPRLPALPHESLLAPRSAAAILQYLLSREVADGPPDVTAAIDAIATGRPLAAMPREPQPTLRFGGQLLIDLSDGMRPFRRDQAEVRDAVLSIMGKGAAEVVYFTDAPLRGAGPGRRWSWAGYRPPAAGRRVLILTDFGIGGDPMSLRRAEPHEWVDFFDLLERNRCTPVALVPYPPARWPAALRARCPMLMWDRNITVGHARVVTR